MRHKTPKSPCPACFTPLDGVSETGAPKGRAPTTGDITVCAYCGAVLIFVADMSSRIATTEELDALCPADKLELVKALQEYERRVMAAQNVTAIA